MAHMEKLEPRILHISQKRIRSSLTQLTDCTSYSPIRFHTQILSVVNRN